MPDDPELLVPAYISQGPMAREILRVWVADGEDGAVHVVLRADAWSDPAGWGILLVDLARHVARAYEEGTGRPADDALARVRAGFDAEWSEPTDEPSGGLTD